RAPTDLIDRAVTSITAEMRARAISQRAALRAEQVVVGVVWLAIACGTFGISILVIRNVMKPLRGAIAVLLDISHGDFTKHLAVETKDEIGAMAAALNATTDAMRTALAQ